MHSLNGCVKDEKGVPVPGVTVYLEEVEGVSRYTLATDAKGCYKQEAIPDGHFDVRAEWNGVTMARKQVALEKAGNVTADLQFTPKPMASAPAAPPMLDLKSLAESERSGKGGRRSFSTRPPLIESITFQPEIANAGDPVMGTVTLTKAAPEDGVLLDVFVNNSVLASVPPELTVAKGQQTASFPIATNRVRGRYDMHVTVKVSDGDTNKSAELPIRSYTRISVNMTGRGYGRVVSTPEGLNCITGICSASFSDGESVQLKAEPKAGTQFGGWSGDCAPAGKVIVTGPMTCSAEFR
jgi:hypothetical protein